MADVTVTRRVARRLPRTADQEVRKLLRSPMGEKIIRDAFFTNAHIAFAAKANGNADEFGDTWPPLAPRTIADKEKLEAPDMQRANAWRRNRRNLMQQLMASGMSPEDAKVKATSMAWGRVTAAGGIMINVRTGDLERSLMKDGGSPDQVFEVRGETYVMGTRERKARWMHDGNRSQNRPPRPVLPKDPRKVSVWIQRAAHLLAQKARERILARLRRSQSR